MQLAVYIALREPGKRGFSSQNLWRMRQFFEAAPAVAKLSPAGREIHDDLAAGYFKDACALWRQSWWMTNSFLIASSVLQ